METYSAITMRGEFQQPIEMAFCLHRILQASIFNLNFTNYELGRFICGHSSHITKALEASSKKTSLFFQPEQIAKLIRLYKHTQEFDLQTRTKEFHKKYFLVLQNLPYSASTKEGVILC